MCLNHHFKPAMPRQYFSAKAAIKCAALACRYYLQQKQYYMGNCKFDKGIRRALAFKRIFIEPKLSDDFKLFAVFALLTEENGSKLKEEVHNCLATTFPRDQYFYLILMHLSDNMSHKMKFANGLLEIIHSLKRQSFFPGLPIEGCFLFSQPFLTLYSLFEIKMLNLPLKIGQQTLNKNYLNK